MLTPKKTPIIYHEHQKNAFVVKYNVFGLLFYTVAALVGQSYKPHFFGTFAIQRNSVSLRPN